MKAIRFHEFGGPEVLRYEDIPDPEPEYGEALIKVRAVGINHVELDVRSGLSRIPLSLPHIPGLEFSGEIAAIRGGTSSFKEGDRVWASYTIPCGLCQFCGRGQDTSCDQRDSFGMTRSGSYAELVTAPIRVLRHLPVHLTFEAAAATQIAFSTAWHVLINQGSLRSGQTVLIHAAGSGIGSAAIQIARLAGATVFTTASTEWKLRKAQDLGAHHVINYTENQFSERVLEMTDGQGVDLIMEHIGGSIFTDSLKCLKKEGTMVVVGGHSGEIVPFDIIPFFRRQLRLIGSSRATQMELNTVMTLAAHGRVTPVIHCILPLSQAGEAHALVSSREIFGKVILVP